jgi:hypothetical protein
MVVEQNPIGVKGDPWGIAHGWFNWPWNFDPTWLLNCDGYEREEKKQGT